MVFETEKTVKVSNTRSEKILTQRMNPPGGVATSGGGGGGSTFVGATVVSGHSFPPVAAAALDGSVFVTQTDLLMSSNGSGQPTSPARHLHDGVDRLGSSSPAPLFGAPPPHLRPMSPFEKAGIPLLRSSTPSLKSSHDAKKSVGQGLPPRSSSSLSGNLNLPILSKTEDARYEPSLNWFESHYYYAKGGGAEAASAAGGKKGKKKSASVTSGTFSLGDDAGGASGGSSSAFFQQVLGTRKITSYVGEYAPSMHEIRQMYDGNACPPNLTKMCSNLIYKSDERGLIGFADVVAFLVDLVPPPAAAAFISTCKQFLQIVGGQTVVQGLSATTGPSSAASLLPPSVAGAAWVHWRLPFPKVYNTFEAFFVTSLSPIIIRSCFDLCDVTHCGYILKDVFRQFRDEERMSSLAATVATSLPPAAPNNSVTMTNGVSSSAIVLPPPALSYLVVKGAWRVFEKIALEEEEKARNAGGKKGKKSKPKKGATGPVTVPGKRQFHISFKEFASAISEDPHIAIAFLPHAIETALASGQLPVLDPVRGPAPPAE